MHDSCGNVTSILDTKGRVCECYRYTTFDTETFVDESSQNPWRFTSKRLNPETGFIYFGHRYYAPEMGRFVTTDPLGFDAGPNLYAYVFNNPLIHFDEYGLEAVNKAGSTAAVKPSGVGNSGKVSASSASGGGGFFSRVGSFMNDVFNSPCIQAVIQVVGGVTEDYYFQMKNTLIFIFRDIQLSIKNVHSEEYKEEFCILEIQ